MKFEQVKEKNNEGNDCNKSRRTFLKTAIATITATILNIFPEFGKVVNASFFNCYSGGTYYCCDISTEVISCTYDAFRCPDLLRVNFYAICNAAFGCEHTCTNLCVGPFINCSFFCFSTPSCLYCTNII